MLVHGIVNSIHIFETEFLIGNNLRRQYIIISGIPKWHWTTLDTTGHRWITFLVITRINIIRTIL